MNLGNLHEKFIKVYQSKPEKVFFSPGRINLIGEHTDYNGGNVFPCTIIQGTYALVKKRTDQRVLLYSENFAENGVIQFDLNLTNYKETDGWANYPKGVIRYVMKSGYDIPFGFECLIFGNIPNGAGLSSSASIEMVTGVLLNGLFQLNIPMLELIQISKTVENEFIGVQTGIMDQFVIGMGRKDAAILLDCNTLHFEYAPIPLERHKIIIMNTNKRRELADSKYNERRNECEEALFQLQKHLSITTLGQLSNEEFESNEHLIQDLTVRKRARHAVFENNRTIEAHRQLKNGNLIEFGQLMNQSHQSLRDDYEVTGKELDCIVNAAWQQSGVIGARMTGAGFGGCAIAIVENELIEHFITNVSLLYENQIGYSADFYVASIGDGAKEITLEEFI